MITFPEDTVVKVHVKHDLKAIDYESYRRRQMGRVGNRTTTPFVCSRDSATYYRLPKGVEKVNLTAQLTQDGFLIIQSRKEQSSVFGFESKRLIPMNSCLGLEPRLSAHDLTLTVDELMGEAYKLWQRVKEITSPLLVEDLDSSFGSDPGLDGFSGSVGFQYSSQSAFGPASTTQSEGAGGDRGSSAPTDPADGTTGRMARSTKSVDEICEEETGSAIALEDAGVETGSATELEAAGVETGSATALEAAGVETGSATALEAAGVETGSATELEAAGVETGSATELEAAGVETGSATELEAAGVETGSTSEYDSEAAKEDIGSVPVDVGEETTKRKTRSAKSTAEEIGKEKTGSSHSKAAEKTVACAIESEAAGDDTSSSAHKVAEETTKKKTRSANSAEETSIKEIGSVPSLEGSIETKKTRSAQSNVTEPIVDQETDSEALPKRITRSTLKTDETDKKQADEIKSVAGKDSQETDSGSEPVDEGSQETAGSDSKAGEGSSKQSEVPRRVRSKERSKETSTISKLKEESKRRKSVV